MLESLPEVYDLSCYIGFIGFTVLGPWHAGSMCRGAASDPGSGGGGACRLAEGPRHIVPDFAGHAGKLQPLHFPAFTPPKTLKRKTRGGGGAGWVGGGPRHPHDVNASTGSGSAQGVAMLQPYANSNSSKPLPPHSHNTSSNPRTLV